jgi:single stranded DNA-binding protein
MNDMNIVLITGRLGKDSQSLGQTGNVTKFSIAVTKNSKKDAAGNWTSETDWINCVYFGKIDLKKGNRIKVQGSWANNNWTDKENVKHYDHHIVADMIRVFPEYKQQEYRHNEPNTWDTHQNGLNF